MVPLTSSATTGRLAIGRGKATDPYAYGPSHWFAQDGFWMGLLRRHCWFSAGLPFRGTMRTLYVHPQWNLQRPDSATVYFSDPDTFQFTGAFWAELDPRFYSAIGMPLSYLEGKGDVSLTLSRSGPVQGCIVETCPDWEWQTTASSLKSLRFRNRPTAFLLASGIGAALIRRKRDR